EQTVIGPDGNPITLPGEPGRFFTDEEKAEWDSLQAAAAGPSQRALAAAGISAPPEAPFSGGVAPMPTLAPGADPKAHALGNLTALAAGSEPLGPDGEAELGVLLKAAVEAGATEADIEIAIQGAQPQADAA